MKKLLTIVLIITLSIFSLFLTQVNAQATLPTGPAELPLGPEESNDQTEEPVEESETSDSGKQKDDTEAFVTGIAVGGSFGLIVGAILCWAFKDKFLS